MYELLLEQLAAGQIAGHWKWVRCVNEHVARAKCHRNMRAGFVLPEHPLDPYFRELRDRRRRELQRYAGLSCAAPPCFVLLLHASTVWPTVPCVGLFAPTMNGDA